MLHDQALRRNLAHALAYPSLAELVAVFRSTIANDGVVQYSPKADSAHRFLVAVIHEKK